MPNASLPPGTNTNAATSPALWRKLLCIAIIVLAIPASTWVPTRDLVSVAATFHGIIVGFHVLQLVRAPLSARGSIGLMAFAALFAGGATLYTLDRLLPTRSWIVVGICGAFGILAGTLAYRDMERSGWIDRPQK